MPFINDKLEYLAAERRRREAAMEQSEQHQEKGTTNLGTRPIETRYRFDVEEVMRRLRSRIFGQEAAMKRLENALKIVRADIADPEKPLYVGLFLGPTGVGKTEFVRVLAEAIHGSRDAFCRVDMNTLSLDHYAAALTGAPPGYVGSKEGSTLLEKEKIEGSYSRPGIILFDEIEKASQQVIQTLLNVFDNGVMRIASGEETIDFRNTLVFMTSNLGAREIQSWADHQLSFWLRSAFYYLNPRFWKATDGETVLDRLVRKRLEATFRPEFLNRIDDIITFNWLNRDTLFGILDILTAQLNRRLQKFHCRLELDGSAKQFLVEKGFDKRYGARALKRAFRQYVQVPVAQRLLDHDMESGRIIYARKLPNDHLRFDEHPAEL